LAAPERGEVKLGRGWLVSRLQVLLQGDRLHLPTTAEARALAEELLEYEIKVDPDGDARFGAFRVGAHDDLVTALGLAVQVEPFEVPIAAPSGHVRPSLFRRLDDDA
jgi:hypothetical protein